MYGFGLYFAIIKLAFSTGKDARADLTWWFFSNAISNASSKVSTSASSLAIAKQQKQSEAKKRKIKIIILFFCITIH